MDQARNLIRGINRGLGYGDDDGRIVFKLESEALDQMRLLYDHLRHLIDRVENANIDVPEDRRPPATITAWRHLCDELHEQFSPKDGPTTKPISH